MPVNPIQGGGYDPQVNATQTQRAQEAQQAQRQQVAEERQAQAAPVDQDSFTVGNKRNLNAYTQMVETLFGAQANTVLRAGGNLNADAAAINDAQKAIGEGGEWSAERTASRILDFAQTLAGDDPENIGVLRDAVQRGFAAAEEKLGGSLPDLSRQTRELVNQSFDDWQENATKNLSNVIY